MKNKLNYAIMESLNMEKNLKINKILNEAEDIPDNMKEIVDAIEEIGWSVDKVGDSEYELENYSPAGEDLIIYVSGSTPEELCSAIYQEADNFDADEHVEMWIDARGNGVAGVPSTRELVEDADAIQEMYNELSEKLDEKFRGRKAIKDIVKEYE